MYKGLRHCYVLFVDGTCPSEGSILSFGAICQYRCRCYGNEQCNNTSGICPGGYCAAGWSGSSCQYGEFIAEPISLVCMSNWPIVAKWEVLEQYHIQSGLKVIKLKYSLKLKIKCNDWLLADTCPQAANHCALF